MFKGQAMRLRFRPENGMKVLVTGPGLLSFPGTARISFTATPRPRRGREILALAFER